VARGGGGLDLVLLEVDADDLAAAGAQILDHPFVRLEVHQAKLFPALWT
jgi:hypothetical protein